MIQILPINKVAELLILTLKLVKLNKKIVVELQSDRKRRN